MQLLIDDINCGKLKPVYLIFGEESRLIEESLQNLIKAISPGGGEWGIEILDGTLINPYTAVAAAQESSLFGDRRLVAVKNINWLETTAKNSGLKNENEDSLNSLLVYLEKPNPDACLALTVRGNIDKRRKLVQQIHKKGRLIECVTPKGVERDAWLARRFEAAGFKVEKRAIAHISVSCVNLNQMANEADKLMLYCADKAEISYNDALATVAESSLLTVFELTDAAVAKNAAKACSYYRRLLQQGEDVQKIFGLLAAQFRNILLVKDMLKIGVSQSVIAKELRLHPYVTEKCTYASRAFSQRQLIKVLEMLLAADIAYKSGQGDLKELLETVILRICEL
ncbi:MAG: DNA polymerase III subunit delta [Firmicutes bacterium]|nr:DNA polymerase III subunit delta [Bacillota bacterium]